MVITCEGCTTRFQLDDARVPDGGIRVRCSRCDHAFFAKPAERAGHPVARAVEEALEAEEISARNPVGLGPGTEGPGDEHDWEFNREPASPGDGPLEVAAPLSMGELGIAAGSGEGSGALGETGALLEAEYPPVRGADPLLDPSPAADPEDFLLAGATVGHDLGDEATFSGDPSLEADPRLEFGRPGMDLTAADSRDGSLDALAPETEAGQVSEAPDSCEGEAPGAISVDGGTTGALESEVSGSAQEGAAGEAVSPGAESALGLGSPEDWDFFANGDVPAVEAGAPVPLARISLGPPSEMLPKPRPPVVADAETSGVRHWLVRVVHTIGWAATAGLVVLLLEAGGGGFPAPAPHQAPSAGLVFEDFGARRLDNAVVGPMRVVEGRVHAPAGLAVSPGMQLVVQLLDRDGTVVNDDAATLGPALSERLLRELSPDEIRERLRGGAAQWLEPGTLASVVAVIERPPASAEHFRIVSVTRPLGPTTQVAERFPAD